MCIDDGFTATLKSSNDEQRQLFPDYIIVSAPAASGDDGILNLQIYMLAGPNSGRNQRFQLLNSLICSYKRVELSIPTMALMSYD